MPTDDFCQVMQARPSSSRVTVTSANGGMPEIGSYLAALQDANWGPDRIPDEDISTLSCFMVYQLGRLKVAVDPATGQKRLLEENDLVKRFRAMGVPDKEMVDCLAYMREMLQNGARASSAASLDDHKRVETRASAFLGEDAAANGGNRMLLWLVRDALARGHGALRRLH